MFACNVYSSNVIKQPIKVKCANIPKFPGTFYFKTSCIFKKQVLIDLQILQIRPTSGPTFVENSVYIHIVFLFVKLVFNCKMRMPGTVKCRPTVAC